MEGELSKEELGSVLLQAMLAQKNLRPQLDRLLQVQRRLQQPLKPSDDECAARLKESAFDVEHILPAFAATLHELAVDQMHRAVALKHLDLACELSKVYCLGIKAAARPLATCLDLASRSGARLELYLAFAAMPDEQLSDALVALRLPACPTTQTEAFALIQAAFFAVKLSKEHHLASCIEHLTGIRPSPVTVEPEDGDSPVDAVTEHGTKTNVSDPAPAAAATGETPQAAANRSVDVDKARDYLDRACNLVTLGAKHIDLAVAVLSSFLDPKEVASISEYTDRAACMSEDHFLQITSLF